MAAAGRLCAALLCGALSLCGVRAAARQPDTLYLWIDAQQARVLIGKRAGGREGGRERRRVVGLPQPCGTAHRTLCPPQASRRTS